MVGDTQAKTTEYYLRRGILTHGQPKGNGNDSQSLLLEAPSSTETWFCGSWAQNSPDETPNYPLSNLSDIDTYSWYKQLSTTGAWIGIQRYLTYDQTIDASLSVPYASDFTWINKHFANVNWTMDYPWSWYWLSLKIKGNHPYWQTTITLTVDTLPNATAGSSGYLFTNSTNSHTSGWITTNTWQDQNLTCGTSYTYTVKYRSGDGTETATTQTTAQTSPCPQSQTTSKSVGQGSDPQPNPVANIASSAIKTIQQKFLNIFGRKANSKDTTYWAPKFTSFNFSTTKLIKSMKTELSRATTLAKSFLKVFGRKPNTKQTQSWSNTFALVKFSVTKLINAMQRDSARIFHTTLFRAHT